ncbi:MAG: hypothetical protein AMS15_09430 [Planctomycetes bacterium DG_23]|nr:MAG: hypothetical protein AMS15_09430 [Planctomycetes bacterium DG_23]
MAYEDLREFITKLEEEGELRRVKGRVSPELEITEITDRVSKQLGPALLFENVKGSNLPLLINAFGSRERMLLALGVKDFSDITGRIEGLLQVAPESGLMDKLKAAGTLLSLGRFLPRMVKTAPAQEVVEKDAPSLSTLPILKCWPEDAGKYITLGMVFTRSLKDGARNAGIYRLQIYDERTTGMHWHIHHDGARHHAEYKAADKKMAVAVALGGDPAITYAATAPLPPGTDEMLFAGFLRQEAVEMVKCETIDMEVPAAAEIILEGYVDPKEERTEGPFGDHTGYYSPPDLYPVFHLTAITHRKNPIYPTTIVGRPPMEDCYLGKATERIFLPLLKMLIPEMVDINLPLFGVFQNWAFVSINKTYPYAARKVLHGLWGLGQLAFTRIIGIFDADVDVHNLEEVLWRLGNNIDPKRDIEFVKGPVDALAHASPLPHIGSKMGIDATRKWKEEGFKRQWPEDIKMSEEIVKLVDERWAEYGL